MATRRLRMLQVAFLLLMLAAWPVAMFHLSSGRPAQALIAAGSAVVGFALIWHWLRTPIPGDR